MQSNASNKSDLCYGLYLLMGINLILHLFSITEYGIFRDEYYYISNSMHLGAGYVDHPPLIGYITWLITSILGKSIFALRIVPVLVSGANIFVAGLIARKLGGKKPAQFLAGFGVLFSPVLLSTASYLSMNVFDQFFWSIAVFYFVKYTKKENPTDLYIFASITGIAFLNKISILFLLFGIFWGIVLTDQIKIFRRKELYISAAIFAILASPYIIWQFVYDFPTLEFMHNASADKIAEVSTFDFISGHLLEFGPANWFFLAGAILFSLFNKKYRYIGIIYISILVFFLLQKSKTYYMAPTITFTIAAGAVYVNSWIERFNKKWILPAFLLFLLPGALFPIPLATPIFSPQGYLSYTQAIGLAPKNAEVYDSGALPQFYADMFGWQELADSVDAAVSRLPEDDLNNLHVFCWNYGEAGALTYYSDQLNIPPVISPHNSHYLWGYGNYDGKNLLFIGTSKEYLEKWFESVELVGKTKCELCMPYESDNPIWICKNLKVTVDEMWKQVKNYN